MQKVIYSLIKSNHIEMKTNTNQITKCLHYKNNSYVCMHVRIDDTTNSKKRK